MIERKFFVDKVLHFKKDFFEKNIKIIYEHVPRQTSSLGGNVVRCGQLMGYIARPWSTEHKNLCVSVKLEKLPFFSKNMVKNKQNLSILTLLLNFGKKFIAETNILTQHITYFNLMKILPINARGIWLPRSIQ